MARRTTSNTAIAALSVQLADGKAPTEFRYLPLGNFKSADGSGRPVGLPGGWKLSRQRAEQIVAQEALRKSRRVIDYEHQTLRAADNGQPAPASGWMSDFEVRDDGLYAINVAWTAQAAGFIERQEYLYISPVFPYDKRTGEVLGIAHAALTNDPGLDDLTDLSTAALSALFPEQEDAPMKELLKALGLPETATEAQALAALTALNNRLASRDTDVAVLTARVDNPDSAKFVAIATLSAVQGELAEARTELAALKAEKVTADVDKVVADALAAGKLTPAMDGWARDLGKNNLAALTAYIEKAPVITKPGELQTGGIAPAGGTGGGATGTEAVAVMKALGLTAEQFAKGKQEA